MVVAQMLRFGSLRWLLALLSSSALVACSSTVDTIGRDPSPSVDLPDGGSTDKPKLTPLVGPDAYANPFHDLLEIPNKDIDARIEETFQQLFHGDPDTQAIYFTVGDDAAVIRDVYHEDVRTEGVGLAMLITVELDKREEFDKLWTYAKRELRYPTGSNAGYFRSYCDTAMSGSVQCVDPYGLQQFVMALIFAHDRWSDIAAIDYGADALDILDVMLHKEEQNGGIVDFVTNTFDAETKLAFDVPNVKTAPSHTRPSIVMPAYYELWGRATGNPFFSAAADAARKYFPGVANQKTGLMPLRSYFDGVPVAGADTYTPEAYRVFLNLVLDQLWTPGDTWGLTGCNRVLTFFLERDGDSGTSYTLDGTPIETNHETALVVVNGITALAAPMLPTADRRAFIQAVWDMKTPEKTADQDNRYYTGILQLFGLLVLSGRMQVL